MRLLPLSIAVLLLLLLPSTAFAWGPGAHLEFGLTALAHLSLLAPGIALALRKHPEDFLYGNIAADITVGKNLSPYRKHCHNWQVAFTLLTNSQSDAERAFAWGYLSHLAADVVAHNYFIPYKIVEHFRRRGPSHAYWEIRFDTLANRKAWTNAKRLSSLVNKHHDHSLRSIHSGPLFSFSINKQLFQGMMLFDQVLTWEKMFSRLMSTKSLPLPKDEVDEMRTKSMENVMDLLYRGEEARCLSADPTGHRNILIARNIRKRLRELDTKQILTHPDDIGERFRPLFREAILSKLSLPSLIKLIEPGQTLVSEAAAPRPLWRTRIPWKGRPRTGKRHPLFGRKARLG
jgi:hypothetical protein